MQFTTFARTGLTVSRLCLGTGTFGKQTDEQESFRIFDRAADAGVNFIDTADIYPGGATPTESGAPRRSPAAGSRASATASSSGAKPAVRWVPPHGTRALRASTC
jgi:aryl-alcohol dehydrogenase-like predicted oxidoreductase